MLSPLRYAVPGRVLGMSPSTDSVSGRGCGAGWTGIGVVGGAGMGVVGGASACC